MNGNTYNKSPNGLFSTPIVKNNNKNVIDISNVNNDSAGRTQRRQTMNPQTYARQQSNPISVNSSSTSSSRNNSPSP